MDQTTFFLDASQELHLIFDKSFVTQHLKAGETLFEQDEYDDRLYVLDEGLLEVSVYSTDGRKLSLNMLQPESLFGEIAMFDPGPRTARVEAIKDCKLRFLRQSTLIPAIKAEPHLAVELLRLAGKRMRWLSQQMEDQVFLSPAARLASKLLYLAGDSGKIIMSQAKMADYVGVTREVVSKTLSEWRRDGIVILSRGNIEIQDHEALHDIKNSKES
jgi:CRP/FNR family cyclic AMP-dependent transcriptional regulator